MLKKLLSSFLICVLLLVLISPLGTAVSASEEKTPASAISFSLTDTLRDGSQVVIVCKAKNVALSAVAENYYLAPIEVAPQDGVLRDPPQEIIWTVSIEEDGYTFSYDGQSLGMQDMFSSMGLGYPHDRWSISEGETEGTYLVFNTVREAYMEYYMLYGVWTTYYNLSDPESFELQFYTYCEHQWDDGQITDAPSCTEEGSVTYTCTLCGHKSVHVLPTVDHTDDNADERCDNCEKPLDRYRLTNCVKDGDEIIIVCASDNQAFSSSFLGAAYNAYPVEPEGEKLLPLANHITWTVRQDGEYYMLESGGRTLEFWDFCPAPASVKSYEDASPHHLRFFFNAEEKTWQIYFPYSETYLYYSSGISIWHDSLNASDLHFYVREDQFVCDHDFDDGTVILEPDCTQAGIIHHSCIFCSELSVQEQPPLGHSFAAGFCVRCGEADPDYVPCCEFVDVPVDAWYIHAVDYTLEKGLLYGIDKDHFAPDAQMTRAMLVTVLWRYVGQPVHAYENSPFQDVSGWEWYAEAVLWASANQLIKGYPLSTSDAYYFDPHGSLTREQLALIFFRFTQWQQKDCFVRCELNEFPDGDSVSPWAKEAMQWAVAAGLIQGTDRGLEPQGTATRAQVAMILMRYLESL